MRLLGRFVLTQLVVATSIVANGCATPEATEPAGPSVRWLDVLFGSERIFRDGATILAERGTVRGQVIAKRVSTPRVVMKFDAATGAIIAREDAVEHPSDPEVSLHTPPWSARSAHSCDLPDRRGRARPAPRHRCSPPRREARSRGAAGAERSELALDGAAARVASGRHPRGHAAEPITRTREEPDFETSLGATASDLEGLFRRLLQAGSDAEDLP